MIAAPRFSSVQPPTNRFLALTNHSSSSSSGEVDSKELYRAVAGILPGDFEVRVHTSEVIVQVASRAADLLEAGKVALEALGETKAAAGMEGRAAAADSIDLEVGGASIGAFFFCTCLQNVGDYVDYTSEF